MKPVIIYNMSSVLVVNFGGPRSLDEVPEFLTSLLCDRDVIPSRFPTFFHNWFFSRIARKRAETVSKDYELIGGRSPIYFDTETIATLLEEKLERPVYTFHRYLPKTHEESLKKIGMAKDLIVFPLFPQFCYGTTGSIARFLNPYFPENLHWVKSYASHPSFIASYQRKIAEFLNKKGIAEEETLLLFSAHGVPKKFVECNRKEKNCENCRCKQGGDPYQKDCEATYNGIIKAFPRAKSRLCYQSKFGRGEWLKPYTESSCENILSWHQGRKNIVFIPMSFTSDHIETLFEIEKLYLPIVKDKNLHAYRCPALNLEPYWIDAIVEILKTPTLFKSRDLFR